MKGVPTKKSCEMGKNQAKFFLSIIVINCIMVPITDSKPNTNDRITAINFWDGHDDASVSHVDICCSIVIKYCFRNKLSI